MAFPGGSLFGGGAVQGPGDADPRIERFIKLVDDGAPDHEVDKAARDVADALKSSPYHLKDQVPFFQRVISAMRGSRAYSEFRLTNGQVVVDKRDKEEETAPQKKEGDVKAEVAKAEVKAAAAEAKKAEEMRDKRAQIEKHMEKGRLDNARLASNVASIKDGRWQDEKLDRLISAFEKLLVQRFEGGKEIAQYLKEGKAQFAEKSEVQWKQFFESFMHRSVPKKVSFAMIEDFLFRGVVQRGQKGIFIGDMRLTGGRIEKFIRVSLLAEILTKLQGVKPGQTVQKGVIKGEGGEELAYLALAAAKRREFQTSEKAADGKFMSERAEQRAAEELGLSADAMLREKARRLKEKGGRRGLGGFFEKDAEPEDIPYQFVPWWHWGNLSRPGRTKIVTVVFYAALLAISLLGAAVITYRLLNG
jgi:hypothetical protein